MGNFHHNIHVYGSTTLT